MCQNKEVKKELLYAELNIQNGIGLEKSKRNIMKKVGIIT